MSSSVRKKLIEVALPLEAINRACIELDFGHSGIDSLQTRQERASAVQKFGEVWWEGRHHEMTQPPMPLP